MPNTKNKKAGGRKKKQEMTLRDLLVTKLKSLYDVEQQLAKALPKMAKAATDQELKSGFEKHARQTEEHAARLERAFETLGEKAQKLQSEAVRGIVADGEWVIKNVEGDAASDAALDAAAQYAEYYEMAGYRSAIQWAKTLGENDVADLLEETFDEEKETSDTLTDLAQSRLDLRANAGRQEGGVIEEQTEIRVSDDLGDDDEDDEVADEEEEDEDDDEA